MSRAAQGYRNCNCVVYIENSLPAFYGPNLNLNGPDWPSAGVFYALDPGLEGRAKWAAILHKQRWVALRYDTPRGVAMVDAAGSL